MANLEEVLASLIEDLPEAQIAGLIGTDGIGVQVTLSDAWQEIEPEIIEIELAALATAVQRAAARLHDEPGSEFFLGTARANLIGTMVDDAHFLVLGLDPGGDLDEGRQILTEAREALEV